MENLKYSKNRRRDASRCPCGGHNRDGKFCPFEGYIDKGHCFSCGETFFPDEEPTQEDLIILNPKTNQNKTNMTPSLIKESVLTATLKSYDQNVFYQYLIMLSNEEEAHRVKVLYSLGTAKYWTGASVFWQTSIDKIIRGGKVVQYQLKNDKFSFLKIVCSRVKGNNPPVKWVHKILKLTNFNLKQCFFGEHLLTEFPDKPIGIVESEKSAMIATLYHPEYLWLASGGADGLTYEKTAVLRGRDVILFPDLGKIDLWRNKAELMRNRFGTSNVQVSDVLEEVATEEDRKNGLDLGDYLIRDDWKTYKNKVNP